MHGLAAKPIIDLELGVPSLDDTGDSAAVVAAAGFVDVAPLAANSPGVLGDRPFGRDRRDDAQ